MAGMVGNNYVNPYYNPYGAQFQNQYQNNYANTLPQQQVVKVNGENGARAFQMGANSSVMLLDESGTIVWLKCTDGAGFPTITPYDIIPHQVAKQPDYSTLENRVAKLEEMINEYATTNSSTIARKSNGKSTSSDSTKD